MSRLCEANAVKQAFNVCTTPTIQSAWDNGQEVHVHALIFDLATGRLKRLAGPISSLKEAQKEVETYWEKGSPASPTAAGVEKSLQGKLGDDLNRILKFEEAI